ncbi:MAG: hypothetical protein ACRDK7_09415 [Solirubrobacteraceae bacterium]
MSTNPLPKGRTAVNALTKVPEITLIFWVLKLLTTGMGEAMSDFLGQQKHELGGRGLGDGTVAGIAVVVFVALVAYVTITKRDVQGNVHAAVHSHPHSHPHLLPQLAPEPE